MELPNNCLKPQKVDSPRTHKMRPTFSIQRTAQWQQTSLTLKKPHSSLHTTINAAHGPNRSNSPKKSPKSQNSKSEDHLFHAKKGKEKRRKIRKPPGRSSFRLSPGRGPSRNQPETFCRKASLCSSMACSSLRSPRPRCQPLKPHLTKAIATRRNPLHRFAPSGGKHKLRSSLAR